MQQFLAIYGVLRAGSNWHLWAQTLPPSQGEEAFLSSLPFDTNKMGKPKEVLKYVLYKNHPNNIFLFNQI